MRCRNTNSPKRGQTSRWNDLSRATRRAPARPAASETVRGAALSVARRLRFLPHEEARFEADLMVAHVLRADRAALYADPARRLSAAQRRALERLAARRRQRAPLAYVLGAAPFMDFEVRVDRRVLVPRPETELLVETALECVRGRAGVRFCDVGAGSGCIAIALARALPDARGVATDRSAGALQVARRNALRLGVAERVRFLRCDLLEGVPESEAFDLICSNPPYVSEEEFAALEPEVRDHEPAEALVAGADGLEFYGRLFAEAPKRLRPEGILVVELPGGKAAGVRSLLERAGSLRLEAVRPDLGGWERVLAARRPRPGDGA